MTEARNTAGIPATNTYWCERAVVGSQVLDGVVVEIEGQRFGTITPGQHTAPDGATRLAGLTVPGFANAHSHAFHRALRSRTQRHSGSFWTWRDTMYEASSRLDPDSYYRLARATFAEMTLAGFTAVGEFHYLHHQPDGTAYDNPNAMGEALVRAAADAGIRITLLDTLYLHGGLGPDGYTELTPPQRRFSDGSVERWIERVEKLQPSVTSLVGGAIHSVRAVDPHAIEALGQWATAGGRTVHVHLSEQPAENEQCAAAHGLSPTALIAERGLLETELTAVHATHLSADDVAQLGSAAITICLCPTTERDLADGIGPSDALATAGANLCVGTDSHAVIDPFEETRAIELDQRLATNARGVHAAGALLAAAGVNGHRSLGWESGEISTGALADLVTVDTNSLRLAGAGPAAVESVVFAATAGDVTDVVVGGQPIVVDRRHQTIESVATELDAAITELIDR